MSRLPLLRTYRKDEWYPIRQDIITGELQWSEYATPPRFVENPTVFQVSPRIDIFAPDVPIKFITAIMDMCMNAHWHKYLFVTKHRERLHQLHEAALLPLESNFVYEIAHDISDYPKGVKRQ